MQRGMRRGAVPLLVLPVLGLLVPRLLPSSTLANRLTPAPPPLVCACMHVVQTRAARWTSGACACTSAPSCAITTQSSPATRLVSPCALSSEPLPALVSSCPSNPWTRVLQEFVVHELSWWFIEGLPVIVSAEFAWQDAADLPPPRPACLPSALFAHDWPFHALSCPPAWPRLTLPFSHLPVPTMAAPAATANKLYEECDGMELMKSEP